MTGGIVLSAPSAASRAQVAVTAQGMITETFSRSGGISGQALADGTIYFLCVGLLAGDVVSNVNVALSVAGAGMTLTKCGLYSKAGVRLALSADQGTAWHSTGPKAVPMISPYTVPLSDGYYIAILAKTGTTMPQMLRGASTATYIQVGSGMFAFAVQTGQTDLPAPATVANGTNFAFWAGIS